MSNAKTNLKRRIARFNKAYPHLAIEVSPIDTKRAFNIAERRLTKAQDRAKFEKAKAKLMTQALETGVKINPNKIRGVRSLAAAKAKIEPIRKFQIAQKKFIDRAAAYNQRVQAGDINKRQSAKFLQTPRTTKELTQFKKALTLLEKQEVAKARKVMKVNPESRFSTTLIERELEQARINNDALFQSRLYYNKALFEAENSPYPELVELFKAIGVQGVLELAERGFTISEFVESSNEDMEDFGPEVIRANLEGMSDTITSPALAGKVRAFLKDY